MTSGFAEADRSRPAHDGTVVISVDAMGGDRGPAAIVAGVVAGWAVSRFVLEVDHSVIWSSAVLLVVAGVLAALAAELAFALRALRVKPAMLLRSE